MLSIIDNAVESILMPAIEVCNNITGFLWNVNSFSVNLHKCVKLHSDIGIAMIALENDAWSCLGFCVGFGLFEG